MGPTDSDFQMSRNTGWDLFSYVTESKNVTHQDMSTGCGSPLPLVCLYLIFSARIPQIIPVILVI